MSGLSGWEVGGWVGELTYLGGLSPTDDFRGHPMRRALLSGWVGGWVGE